MSATDRDNFALLLEHHRAALSILNEATLTGNVRPEDIAAFLYGMIDRAEELERQFAELDTHRGAPDHD